MKYLATVLFAVLLTSCSTDEPILPDPCGELEPCEEGICEFTLEEVEATTTFLSCYDSWGVLAVIPEINESYPIGLIVDDFPENLQKDSMTVFMCGYARENTIPLMFPDPFLNAVYQFEAVTIEELE